MPSAGPEQDLSVALAAIWERRRQSFAERAATIEAAVGTLLGGELGEDERATAEREAHKLAGSLGTFGLPGGSELARELELAFGRPRRPDSAPRLAELVLALQRDIARGPVAPSAGPDRADAPDAAEPIDTILIFSDDDGLVERVGAEVTTRGLPCVRLHGGQEVGGTEADAGVAIVDLDGPSGEARALDVVTRLAGSDPPVPTVVLAPSGEFALRVEVARRGGAVFLERGVPTARVVAAATTLLERRRTAEAHVLALDDDPAVLDALAALLAPDGIEVTRVEAPERLWELLPDLGPDLLILDVDMPTVDGIELCGVLRGDPRFADLPVLFLTALTEPGLLRRIFAAGADDYVAKPIIGAELVGRIRNRIARARLVRELADRDALTGVASRRKSSVDIVRSLALADRYGQPLSLAMLDVDRFKLVNDQHGHAVGDAVLQTLGQLLSRAFRGEDTVGRWGGEEFVVCLYGSKRDDAFKRISSLLDRFRAIELPTAAGPPVRATFSAGIAEYPLDASDVQALHRAADTALYAAKAAGRECVALHGSEPLEGTRVVDM